MLCEAIMNKTYEVFAKYYSNSGIYMQPKKRIGRRGSFARTLASVSAFLERIKAIRALKVVMLALSAVGFIATFGLLEVGLLSVLSALFLGGLSALLFCLFLHKKKTN